jgi:hypothetical protein
VTELPSVDILMHEDDVKKENKECKKKGKKERK